MIQLKDFIQASYTKKTDKREEERRNWEDNVDEFDELSGEEADSEWGDDVFFKLQPEELVDYVPPIEGEDDHERGSQLSGELEDEPLEGYDENATENGNVEDVEAGAKGQEQT